LFRWSKWGMPPDHPQRKRRGVREGREGRTSSNWVSKNSDPKRKESFASTGTVRRELSRPETLRGKREGGKQVGLKGKEKGEGITVDPHEKSSPSQTPIRTPISTGQKEEGGPST